MFLAAAQQQACIAVAPAAASSTAPAAAHALAALAGPARPWPAQLGSGPCQVQQQRLKHTVKMVLLQVGWSRLHLAAGSRCPVWPALPLRAAPQAPARCAPTPAPCALTRALCTPRAPQDHPNLGSTGEVVDVAAGYARHSLFPQQIADYAVPGVLRRMRVSAFGRRRLRRSRCDIGAGGPRGLAPLARTQGIDNTFRCNLPRRHRGS